MKLNEIKTELENRQVFGYKPDGNTVTDAQAAETFIQAIKTLSEKPENLQNLECYLSRCFTEWLEKYANTPEGIANELKNFSEIERKD